MSFEFREAKRRDAALLIAVAGGTGSGKTESALRLATGLSGGKKFVVIDTERGRALHKADDYSFDHAELNEPFTPEAYGEAIKAADAAGYPVIVIDSGSHEYEGEGGVLDMQADEFARMGAKEGARMSSWIEPKRRHKKAFVNPMLRARAHIILCLRAEDKIEILKVDGKTVVRPKQTLTGLDGWVPICEKRLPFEMSLSFLVTADAPGVPKPIKLEGRFKTLVPLDEPLSEATGERLAAWAAGTRGTAPKPTAEAAPVPVVESETVAFASGPQRRLIFARAKECGVDETGLKAIFDALTGQTSSAAIPASKVDEILAAIVPAESPFQAPASVRENTAV